MAPIAAASPSADTDALKEELQVGETPARLGASLAAMLDPDKVVQAVTEATTALTSAEFGAFSYNVDESGDSYQLTGC